MWLFMCASVGSSRPNSTYAAVKDIAWTVSFWVLFSWTFYSGLYRMLFTSQMEKCQENKKNKTAHLQPDKDDEKEEAGVQIESYPAGCPLKAHQSPG